MYGYTQHEAATINQMSPPVATRVRIVKNELGGSATQQELRGLGSQWNELGNWGGGGGEPHNPRQFEPWLQPLFSIALVPSYTNEGPGQP